MTEAQRDAISNPKDGLVIYNTDTDKLNYYNGGSAAWSVVGSGSGSGGVNYISNGDAEDNATTGWVLYLDASGATPVDGTGGTSFLTLSTQATTKLRGNFSFKYVVDGADRQGNGISYDYTIDKADMLKPLSVSFDYNTDGIYAAGDFAVYIYDVDSSTLITPRVTEITGYDKDNTGSIKFVTDYTPVDVTSTNYRLIVHIANATAAPFDLYFDNVVVGPESITTGAIVTEWEAFTPTWVGITNITSEKWSYRRVGSNMEITGDTKMSGAVTGIIDITIPNSLTIDATNIDTASESYTFAGEVGALDSGTAFYDGKAGYSTSTKIRFQYNTSASSFNATTPFTWTNTDIFSASISVPIAEWAGSGTTNLGANDVEYWSHDGTNVVRGPQGAAIPTTTPASNLESLELTGITVQTTDSVKLELQPGGAGSWVPVGDLNVTVLDYDGTNYIGAGIREGNINADVRLARGKYRQNDDATTRTWASIAGGTRWRVVKHRSGIPVGFGLATEANSGLVKLPDGQVRCDTASGHGSTGTKIRTFTNATAVGTSITYASDTTNGDTFTINEDGVYAVSYTDRRSGGSGQLGVSKNASTTTNVNVIAADDRLCFMDSTDGLFMNIAATIRLVSGDVVRVHGDGNSLNSEARTQFSITQVSKL